jgi:ankyrin repeat protein
MAADFQSLPNELILHLGEMLLDSALNSLVLTNRRFATLLNPMLWKLVSDEDEGLMQDLPFPPETSANNVVELLGYAVATRNSLMVQKVIRLGNFDFKAHGDAITYALRGTVAQGNQPWLELVLSKVEGQDGTVDVKPLSSLVLQAVELENTAIVERLLRHGQIHFSCWDKSCHSILEAKNDRLLRTFLDTAQLNRVLVAKDLDKPFRTAVISGHIPALETLRQQGAEVNPERAGHSRYDQAPLHIAVHRGDHSVITWLLDHGANVNALDSSNHTAAYIAARDEKLLRLLVGYGADVRLVARNGYSPPLVLAARSKSLDAFKYLLSFYDKLSLQPENIEWYSCALLGAECPEIISCLLDRVDLTKYGEDLLFCTRESCSVPLLKALVAGGVSLRARFSGGGTILHHYAYRPIPGWPRSLNDLEREHVAAANFILDVYPEGLHEVDKDGNTPLHLAASTTFRLMVQTLLERAASPLALNLQGDTPIDSGRNVILERRGMGSCGLARNNPEEVYDLLKSYGPPE